MTGSGVDIRSIGSGNPGFNNVLRYSKLRAALCLTGDLGKGIVAVLLLTEPRDSITVAWLCGLAVVLGHCYSPWLKFNGGKGIATSAGVMLVLFPLLAVICIVVYVVARVAGAKKKWREAGALASLGSWALFALLLLVSEGPRHAVFAAVMLTILAWRHKSNLERLAGAAQSH